MGFGSQAEDQSHRPTVSIVAPFRGYRIGV